MKSKAKNQSEEITHHVDPARLHQGTVCPRTRKTLNEGDIHASYSADRIGESHSIRKPFQWRLESWICVDTSPKGAKAYRLLPIEAFEGEVSSYHEKRLNGEKSRRDRSGFYHGIEVTYHHSSFILCGPPALFVADETLRVERLQQMDLFGGAL